jgi:hypothetical protein
MEFFVRKNAYRTGLRSAGTNKLAISMRNPVLGRILAKILPSAPITPKPSMENPILRTEFLFYVDLYVNQRSKK